MANLLPKIFIGLFCFVCLTSCSGNSTLEADRSLPGSDSPKLQLKAGTTVIDESFFSDLTETVYSDRSIALERAFLRHTGKQLSLQQRSGQALGLNLFVALSDELGAASLTLKGPSGDYQEKLVYPENARWQTYYPLAAQGNGNYLVTASAGKHKLKQAVQVNFEEALPIVEDLKVTRDEDIVLARWTPVDGAQSYLALLYNFDRSEFVGGYVTKDSSLLVTTFPAGLTGKNDISLFALSWDASLSTDEPYPTPLPAFNASAKSAFFYDSQPELQLGAVPAISGSLGKTQAFPIKVKNEGGGPLVFTAALDGVQGLEISSGKSGAILYEEETNITISLTCGDTAFQEDAILTLESNTPDAKRMEIPLQTECLAPVSSTLETKLETSSLPQALLFSSDAKNLYAANSSYLDGIGHSLRYLTIDLATEGVNFEEYSYIDSPSLGWLDKTETFASIHRGSCGPPNHYSCNEYKRFARNGELLSTTTLDIYSEKVFSPRGRYLAAWPKYGEDIKILDAESVRTLLTLEGSNALFVNKLRWNRDGTKIANSANGILTVWDVVTGKKSFEGSFSKDGADCSFTGYIHWSPDEKTMYAGDCRMHLETGVVTRTGNDYWTDGKVLMSSDGRLRLTYDDRYRGNTLTIASAYTNTTLATIKHDLNPELYGVMAVAWSDDGNYLAVGKGVNTDSDAGEVYIWSLR